MDRSYIIAGLVAVVAIAWVATSDIVGAGSNTPKENTNGKSVASPSLKEETYLPVRVVQSVGEQRHKDIVVRGRTAVEKMVEIKSEVQARVVDLPVRKGTRIKKGQVFARLALDDRTERLKEAKAMMRLRETELNAARELSAKGFKPQNKLMENEAQYDAAKAATARMEMEISKLTIMAPFDGVLEELPAEIGAFLKVGDSLALLVAQDPILVIGQVSERDIGNLKVGTPGRAMLATGEKVQGKIRYLASTAEPQTRTFRLELEVPNPDGLLRDGLTAELYLPVQSVLAHRLSPQALTLNDKGIVGLRLVNENSIAQFHPAEVLSEGADGIWIGGLPEKITVIVVGQEFVREGQKVKPVSGDSGS